MNVKPSGRNPDWCSKHPTYRLKRKQDYQDELCDLLGIDQFDVRSGSSLLRVLFDHLTLAVGVSNANSMPHCAERVARKLGYDWHQSKDRDCTYDSRLTRSKGGSTVTARGMECLVKALRKHLRAQEFADGRMPRRWLIQCSPTEFDILQWWIDGNRKLPDWSVARHLRDIAVGDEFALWVAGRHAGVYAVGTIGRRPNEGRSQSPYWKQAQRGPVTLTSLRELRFFFDSPINKSALIEDPDFAGSPITRMPRSANPVRLTEREWNAIIRLAVPGRRGASPTLLALPRDVTVMRRDLGRVPETTTVTTAAAERTRNFAEARLVDDYSGRTGRSLVVLSGRTPDQRLLVADAFDPRANLLIEAKAQASRADIRMAIGQLFDYQFHLAPDAKLAVLLPEAPEVDIRKLLRSLQILVIVV